MEEHTEVWFFPRYHFGGNVLMDTSPRGCFPLPCQLDGDSKQDLKKKKKNLESKNTCSSLMLLSKYE